MLKIAFHPIYKHPLPEGHRFPMDKYDLLPEQLIYEGDMKGPIAIILGSEEDGISPEYLKL